MAQNPTALFAASSPTYLKGFCFSVFLLFQFSAVAPAAERSKGENELLVDRLAATFLLNSSVSADTALKFLFRSEDLNEISSYLEQRKIDPKEVRLFEAPAIDDKIFYGKKTAEIQGSSRIKVNGYILKHMPSLTISQNFIRLIEAFEGKKPRDFASVSLSKSQRLLSNFGLALIESSKATVVLTDEQRRQIALAFRRTLEEGQVRIMRFEEDEVAEKAIAKRALAAAIGSKLLIALGGIAEGIALAGQVNKVIHAMVDGKFTCGPILPERPRKTDSAAMQDGVEKKDCPSGRRTFIYHFKAPMPYTAGYMEKGAARVITGEEIAKLLGVKYQPEVCGCDHIGFNYEPKCGLNKNLNQVFGDCNEATANKATSGFQVLLKELDRETRESKHQEKSLK